MHKVTITLVFLIVSTSAQKPKHIVLILADDLGYNDVSWHNPDIISPNLEALARSGIILEGLYVQPLCTPSRAALLTGYYPIHTGRQLRVINHQTPIGLFTNFTLMPERLNHLGYHSHMIGKWHLGFCNEAYLPTRRGFSSFQGFYNGYEDYFNHTVYATGDHIGKCSVIRLFLQSLSDYTALASGYDFRLNDKIEYPLNNTYSTHTFVERARRVINHHVGHHPEAPLFLYLPIQSVHAPRQVPDVYRNMYPNIQNEARRTLSGMVTAMDDAIGNVTQALKDSGIYNDTIILFMADNGGKTADGQNNFPLRGVKSSMYEGGTRSSSFVHAPFLKNGGRVYKGLLHATDWLPTLYSAAGGDVADLGNIDGIDQWDSIIKAKPSRRHDMLYNIRPMEEYGNAPGAALRIHEMKLICGESGKPDSWIRPEDVGPHTSLDDNEDADDISFYQETGIRTSFYRDAVLTYLNQDTKFTCAEGEKTQGHETSYADRDVISLTQACRSGELPVQLFNLTADPTEHIDISENHPDILEALLDRLEEYEASMIPPHIAEEVDAGNPAHFGGVFSTGWCQAEP